MLKKQTTIIEAVCLIEFSLSKAVFISCSSCRNQKAKKVCLHRITKLSLLPILLNGKHVNARAWLTTCGEACEVPNRKKLNRYDEVLYNWQEKTLMSHALPYYHTATDSDCIYQFVLIPYIGWKGRQGNYPTRIVQLIHNWTFNASSTHKQPHWHTCGHTAIGY